MYYFFLRFKNETKVFRHPMKHLDITEAQSEKFSPESFAFVSSAYLPRILLTLTAQRQNVVYLKKIATRTKIIERGDSNLPDTRKIPF